MSLPATPDWLTLHDGTLAAGLQAGVVFVSVAGRPQYRLDARPAQNQVACSVTQTVDGKTLEHKAGHPTESGALLGGLGQVRTKIGWEARPKKNNF